ncbi:MAG: hypothetical protein V4591_11325 [Bdellovibrionota bacterium]
MEILLKKYEGKTYKQKNPFQKKTLAWCSWSEEILVDPTIKSRDDKTTAIRSNFSFELAPRKVLSIRSTKHLY